MRPKRKLLLLVLCIALACAAAAGGIAWHLVQKRNTGGMLQEVRSLAALQQRMENLADASDTMTFSTLGEVKHGGTDLPVNMLTRTPRDRVRFTVLLTGGIHGNEPAGTEFLVRFAEALAADETAWPGIALDIVPAVNPWGWVHATRRNGNGCDLNREFATFKAPESVLMRDLFRRKTYDLIVDFHEDGRAGGFYFYRLANPGEALCRSMIEAVLSAGFPVHDGRVMKIFRARDGVITSPLWTLRLARVLRQLSMSNYFRLEGCPRAFLFESPKWLPLETRISMHKAALDAALKTVDKDLSAARPPTEP